MSDLLKRLWRVESGEDNTEYALLAALLALVLIISLYHFGRTTSQSYQSAGSVVANASGGASGGGSASGTGGSAAGGQSGSSQGGSGSSGTSGSSGGSQSGGGSGSGGSAGSVNKPPVGLGNQ